MPLPDEVGMVSSRGTTSLCISTMMRVSPSKASCIFSMRSCMVFLRGATSLCISSPMRASSSKASCIFSMRSCMVTSQGTTSLCIRSTMQVSSTVQVKQCTVKRSDHLRS